jgi:hypothetical protein
MGWLRTRSWCSYASAAARARESGGLFRHMMLRHSSVEEGRRVEATRASRFERLKNQSPRLCRRLCRGILTK